MRCASRLLLALPALALAQEQFPIADKIKGWLNQAQSFISSAVPAVPSTMDAGAAKVAEHVEIFLTLDNWQSVLAADPSATTAGPDDWMVYITGGNRTCYGLCGNATIAWNESVALLSALPTAPKFAVLDCEEQPILCNAWSVGPPSIYYMSIPHALADQSTPATTVRWIPLNRTSVIASDITTLVTKQAYKNTEPYEGIWHPFNGLIAQYDLALPVGYVVWGFSKMPSWLPMIAISFLSRSFM
ncbi:hypothetical protein K432DRAFT_286154 [Lepidopterella palustris CBS 459.81]|uniref:Uncharacterized protein n=1 Tax=Lepidopterella palustris CBS 459.81 TaxID=1314670 RepID=A0A8E2EKP6_9PEZI|nr:hypothetical protein K432DRAFT_286154 [Lepidopterella palustris CBS 459.81]